MWVNEAYATCSVGCKYAHAVGSRSQAENWWLRDSNNNNNWYANYVNNDGNVNNNNVNNDNNGVAPGSTEIKFFE